MRNREIEIHDAAIEYIKEASAKTKCLAYGDFTKGALWADKTMIKKACQWILYNMPKYVKANQLDVFINNEDMASDFRKAMEE